MNSTLLPNCSLDNDDIIMEYTYNTVQVLDNGSFGVVYQGITVETGETVAIKKVLQDRRYKNRELDLMRDLRHPNIIAFRHAFFTTEPANEEVYLNIVMDCVPETMFRVTEHYSRIRSPVPLTLFKLYSYQMVRALAYLHATGITHRDVKPQNYLVDTTTHSVKLCDFGSAKRLVPGEPSVAYICSRYYRAPELVLGATQYTSAIDIWSVSCVLAELLLGRPLFPGKNGVDQLVEIIKVLGTPTNEQVLEMNSNYQEFRFPVVNPSSLARVFSQNVHSGVVGFLSSMLVYTPQQRPRAIEVLAHPFFDVLRDASTQLPSGGPLPALFDFTAEELATEDPELIRKLIPGWVRH